MTYRPVASAQAFDNAPALTDELNQRVLALRDFVAAADGVVPEHLLADAREVSVHASERLSLSGAHTVVALAGATGSGKSSLFNAMARMEISPVGVRRPLTTRPFACVWGAAGAGPLLDWLDIPRDRRFQRESALDGEDELALRGLILLDLPDFDSIATEHRIEVDRVLALVDLIVWVVDPQKYGDQVIHERYLREFRDYHDITVVVLNQMDRLGPADLERCLADLRRLLDGDGLAKVPVLATSTEEDPPGPNSLRAELRGAVVRKVAARQRLSTDVDQALNGLAGLVGPAAAIDPIGPPELADLTDAMATAAGLPAVVDAGVRAYRHRARRATGWPIGRVLRTLRPDPLRRLRSSDANRARRPGDPLPEHHSSADEASIALAIRAVAGQATEELPDPWPRAVLGAGRAELPQLSAALDQAVARTDLGVKERRPWWRMAWLLQWLATLAVFAALGWWGAEWVVRKLDRRLPPLPAVGGLNLPLVVILGGLALSLLVSLLAIPLISNGARKAKTVMVQRLHAAVTGVADQRVAGPMREVVARYRDARAALVAADDRTRTATRSHFTG